ncbi:TetR/AcrR family transcriptional regulator [Methylobacterium sp. NEAU K]|uniref:acrylate utilization transcriptional regulator AcuR n=1 Tax=Methylobacterium sp. NEAU K TaxID=3064946 RepID=UPI0027343700|nr:TetR/AcrR family transcriptional regulator [Methylobacterium sp. NEAU K]MDP4005619.1 TetR/AcrR family transcriptional regulator [Methylobacterium sp. NEAU K]
MKLESAMAVTPRKRGRPPRLEPAYGTSREALIRAGVALLSEKGYSATGLEEVLRSAGVPKGSFYHYFASKDAFGAELIDAYATYFAHKLDRWLLDGNTAPLQRLRNFVADARTGMARYEFRRGCVVGNLGQEMSALPELFRDRLHGVLLDWQARTERCLRDAQASGEIAAKADCTALAAFFWIGWEGAVLRAKLERSPEPLDLFADLFLTCLAR